MATSGRRFGVGSSDGIVNWAPCSGVDMGAWFCISSPFRRATTTTTRDGGADGREMCDYVRACVTTRWRCESRGESRG